LFRTFYTRNADVPQKFKELNRLDFLVPHLLEISKLR